MKEDFVLIEVFPIIFNKVILSMNVEHIHLITPVVKYQSGNSIDVSNYPDDDSMKGIEDTKTNLPELKNDGRMYVYLQECMFIYKVIILNKIS